MICTKCKEDKDVTGFFPSTLKTSTRWCKSCMTAATRSWAKHNPEKCRAASARMRIKHNYAVTRKEKNRWTRVLQKYGITKNQYIVLLAHQEFQCPICDTTLVNVPRVNVDHNHTTGKVRGLLCNNCNRGIGLLQDNSAVLSRAAQYVSA